MRFNSVGECEEIVWMARLADLPRGENRAILQRTYNGEPPFNPEKDVENNREINRNFLEGTRILSEARRQWNSGFLRPGDYFTVTIDSGPPHKRTEWGHIITKHLNRQLKRAPAMMQQIRETGAQVMLHGPGPVVWPDRRKPIPTAIPISSLMIPSETDIDFTNLEWYATFHEWTPAQLWMMTHGPKVDPGWNMPAVESAWQYVKNAVQKEPNATAFQYMPERLEELRKQDLGLWGTDAVPTVDVWDVQFRESDDGDGWYRRIFLDWGVSNDELAAHSKQRTRASSRNTTKGKDGSGGFLYSSGKRKYSNYLSEMLHCQYADTSCAVKFKYHSVRSLGWMMWGVVDLLNRLHCQFTENIFMNLLWWFRVANQNDFARVKKAMFEHMGVIPAGVTMVSAAERFKPDPPLIQMGFSNFRQNISENAASFTQDFDRGTSGKEMTATETMARVNSVNSLVSGMLSLAYEYAKPQYREICRRFCIKTSPYRMVRDFRLNCLRDGVPAEVLNVERWQIEPEKVLGAGNKTLEIAQANQLGQMRKNLGPDAQRKVDHIMIEAFSDDPALAEELAPTEGQKRLSPSANNAQFATERILRGLKFELPPEGVPEEYIITWLGDMAVLIKQIQGAGNVGTQEQIVGLANLGEHIKKFLDVMAENDEEKNKVREYSDVLSKLMNFVKGFAQRLKEQQPKGNGADPSLMAKLQFEQAKGALKLKNTAQSHAEKTAQKQAAFELQQQNEDRRTAAEIRRENARTAQELEHNRLRALNEPTNEEK